MTALTYQEIAECSFPGDLVLVAAVLEKMQAYFIARGLRPKAWEEFQLAAAEALNNAVEHGCANLPEGVVRARWGWLGETLWVEVTDPGSFEPPDDPLAALLPEDLLAEGGRGGFIMAALTDHVEHRATPEGHTLRMEKNVGRPSQSDSIADMEQTIQAMGEELSQRYEDISALFSFAEELATSTTFAEFLERSLRRLLELVSARGAYVRLVSAAEDTLYIVDAEREGTGWLRDDLPLDLACTETQVFRGGQPAMVEDCSRLDAADPLQPHRGVVYVCPIFFQSRTLGCLVMLRQRGHFFTGGELGIVRVVADFLGIVRTTTSLQESRQQQLRAQRELEIASAIQQSLMPRVFPDNPRFSIFGICQSAQEVGGDYFDAKQLPDGGLLLMMADVMGKGVPAALLATILRTAIHARLDLAPHPGQLLTLVNRQISSDLAEIDMFITVQLAYLPAAGDFLLVANGGHCPLVHLRHASGEAAALQGSGIPLGILPDFDYQDDRYPLEPRDRLVFFTDGLYEVEDAAGRMLEVEGFIRQTATLRHWKPPEFCRRLLQYVKEYTGLRPASDDRTLLTIDREF
jgi:serine phosphatase RsbU (regulator of sigma subunit)/anti-sigma regulatory factor (Ser/Thr protein kinase)